MSTKIVLNKKNANDEFGILSIQSFDNGKKIKKSLGISVSIDDFKYHFNSDFNFFNPKKIRFTELNSKLSESIMFIIYSLLLFIATKFISVLAKFINR